MGNLSMHFSRREFACKCGCGQDTVDAELITVLEEVREKFGPITVNSGNRCPEYNRRVGGAPQSQHLRSRAADITCRDATPAEMHAWLDKRHPGGLGLYPHFVHVDTRADRARWGNT